eukprot:2848944-Pleurochrysis_carterae.AAC.1
MTKEGFGVARLNALASAPAALKRRPCVHVCGRAFKRPCAQKIRRACSKARAELRTGMLSHARAPAAYLPAGLEGTPQAH